MSATTETLLPTTVQSHAVSLCDQFVRAKTFTKERLSLWHTKDSELTIVLHSISKASRVLRADLCAARGWCRLVGMARYVPVGRLVITLFSLQVLFHSSAQPPLRNASTLL